MGKVVEPHLSFLRNPTENTDYTLHKTSFPLNRFSKHDIETSNLRQKVKILSKLVLSLFEKSLIFFTEPLEL